jgi:S1-C subfamily serine protease
MSKFLLLLTFLSCTTPSDNPFCPTGEVETFFVKRHEKRHALRSRMATHRVFSIDVNEMVGVGTGTVFDFEGTTVVLTAAHVVSAPGSRVSIEVGSRFYSCEVVYFDSLADLAVLVPESSANLHPLPWKTTPPRQMGIYDEVSYTGYPNNDAKLSVKGYISAVSENGNYYLHSYAWSGASGSSVYDKNGKLLGVLIAIALGSGPMGMPVAIEDVVVVVPIWKLQEELLRFNIESLDK